MHSATSENVVLSALLSMHHHIWIHPKHFWFSPAISTECDRSVWIQCCSSHNAYGGQIQLKTWFLALTVSVLCLWMPLLVVCPCLPAFSDLRVWMWGTEVGESLCETGGSTRCPICTSAGPEWAAGPQVYPDRFTERERDPGKSISAHKVWWLLLACLLLPKQCKIRKIYCNFF